MSAGPLVLATPRPTEVVEDGLELLPNLSTLREHGVITATSFDVAVLIERGFFTLDQEVGYERWLTFGRFFAVVGDARKWWVGDWFVFGEGAFGEKSYAEVEQVTGIPQGALRRYRYVAERVARSRRRENLSFSHHEEVAPLEPVEQEKWLARASEQGLTREALRQAIREETNPTEKTDPLFGDDGPLDEKAIVAAATAVANAAQRDGSTYRVPTEPMSRLLAALGREA